MRVDSHHHFWQFDRFSYPWISADLKPLHHDFGPPQLECDLQRHHIDRSVLVQTISSLEETKWFLELAGTHSTIGGVVGWVDLADAHVSVMLDELRERPGLVGIRHVVHDEPDERWILRPAVLRGLGQLAERGLPYDLLIRPRHLEAACELAAALPELSIVVDHLAKPEIARRTWEPWARGIKRLAGFPNVCCKISGMITEADWYRWEPRDFLPYVKHVIECFGPSRVMYGSDWPVCLLAGTYARVIEAAAFCIGDLSPAEQREIMGETAARFYRLPNVDQHVGASSAAAE